MLPLKGQQEPIDSCIADLVLALQPLAVSSCCGHGDGPGYVNLEDGRRLVVLPAAEDWRRPGQRDVWNQVKLMFLEWLWGLGVVPELGVTYDLAWPLRIVGVAR